MGPLTRIYNGINNCKKMVNGAVNDSVSYDPTAMVSMMHITPATSYQIHFPDSLFHEILFSSCTYIVP